MYSLSRREILECLVRQGLTEISRMKSECRRFEQYWQERAVRTM